jgi:hypothetical protein
VSKQKIDKAFISEIDKKLFEFDQTHAPSKYQQEEIDKYKRVFALRDNPAAAAAADKPKQKPKIWEDF